MRPTHLVLLTSLSLVVLFVVSVFFGCSSSDDGSTPETTGAQIVEIEPSNGLRDGVADFGTAALAVQIEEILSATRPVGLPAPDASLSTLLEDEVSSYRLVAVEISEAALMRRPFELGADDLRFFVIDVGGAGARAEGAGPFAPSSGGSDAPRTGNGDASASPTGVPTGDAELKDAVREFLDGLGETGLDTSRLEDAWSSTQFHAAADFPGGLPEGTSDGATFLWDGAVFWNASIHNGHLLFWSDGYNHMVLADRHAQALRDREFTQEEFSLNGAMDTVLHEFGHVIMSRTGCAEDDDEDLMAATLEHVLTNRVEMSLAEAGAGAPRAGDINSYSDQVAELVRLGGTNCLRDLGWGLPAEVIELDVPETVQTGQTFDLEIFIKRIGGDPASGEFVWTWVETQIQVVQLSGLGLGSRTITAPNEPGEIRIRVKALGMEALATVEVVGDPVGPCCLLGECALRSELGCAETGGSWGGSGGSCEPNPCPQPGACCVLGECSVVANELACVESSGEWQGEGVLCGPETCPVPLGACCNTEGECALLAEAECSGSYQGDLTECAPNPCPQPGACCIGSTCTLALSELCDGDFLGEDTSCDPDPCFVPGACCGSDGGCTLLTQPECNGNFLGEGVPCDPNMCAQPGACCGTEGDCALLLSADCDGSFQGEGTSCDPNPCPQPPQGACCWGNSNERCTVRTETRCSRELDGVYLGDGTTCFAEPCTDPLAGACCLTTGHCEFLRQASCYGEFFGIGTPCSPGLCDPPSEGACCFASGSCFIQPSGNCIEADGQYQGDGTSCDPNPCAQPGAGACCFAGGGCFLQSPSDCASNDGQYQGDGTVCDPNPCEQPASGACCLSQGACQVLSPADCTSADGQYQGDGTVCDPNPCEQPASGACCLSQGACQVLSPADCTSADGQYQGDGTVCDPNPCLQATVGACCFELGSCQLISESACADSPGIYLGNGTVCDPNPCPQPGACCFPSGTCQVLDTEPCTGQGGVYLGDGTSCDPNPCPLPVTVTFLQSGVAHFDGFSEICLWLFLDAPDLTGALATIEFTGPSSSGTIVLPVLPDCRVNLQRDIFLYGTYSWQVTDVSRREDSFEIHGESKGAIVVTNQEQPCTMR